MGFFCRYGDLRSFIVRCTIRQNRIWWHFFFMNFIIFFCGVVSVALLDSLVRLAGIFCNNNNERICPIFCSLVYRSILQMLGQTSGKVVPNERSFTVTKLTRALLFVILFFTYIIPYDINLTLGKKQLVRYSSLFVCSFTVSRMYLSVTRFWFVCNSSVFVCTFVCNSIVCARLYSSVIAHPSSVVLEQNVKKGQCLLRQI